MKKGPQVSIVPVVYEVKMEVFSKLPLKALNILVVISHYLMWI